MNDPVFDKLLAFLNRLEQANIWYRISKSMDDAVSVEAYSPGEHWEVDFFADGDVYVERFRSNGTIEDEAKLEDLFTSCLDDVAAPEIAVQHDSAHS